MLGKINPHCRNEALTTLRWLAFEQRPLTIGEVAEATIINPDDGTVDRNDRGQLTDVLNLLSGLVILKSSVAQPNDIDSDSDVDPSNVRAAPGLLDPYRRLRLAHFSVKDYLVSKAIQNGGAKFYSLHDDREHRFISQNRLTYLLRYSSSQEKTSTIEDLEIFPLLRYAAHS